jgi:hypothetical protein
MAPELVWEPPMPGTACLTDRNICCKIFEPNSLHRVRAVLLKTRKYCPNGSLPFFNYSIKSSFVVTNVHRGTFVRWKFISKLFPAYLTNSIYLNISWVGASFSATQEFLKNLWKTKIHFCFHRSPPLVSILSRINPFTQKIQVQALWDFPQFSYQILQEACSTNGGEKECL